MNELDEMIRTVNCGMRKYIVENWILLAQSVHAKCAFHDYRLNREELSKISTRAQYRQPLFIDLPLTHPII